MRCFSRHDEKVWSARIVACRPLDAGSQLRVYGMSLEVASDVATFSASNERIEPQDVDVAFGVAPTAAVKSAFDRATR